MARWAFGQRLAGRLPENPAFALHPHPHAPHALLFEGHHGELRGPSEGLLEGDVHEDVVAGGAVEQRALVVLAALDRVAEHLVRREDGLEPLLRRGFGGFVAHFVGMAREHELAIRLAHIVRARRRLHPQHLIQGFGT